MDFRPDEEHIGGSDGCINFKDEDNKADGSALTFPSIAAKLGVALDTHFPEGSGVRLIAEPGRYFVGSSHTLAVNVIGRKAEKSDDGATTEHVSYYVNDGIYGAFNCIMYDHAEVRPDALRAPHAEPVPLGNLDAASSLVVPSTIWGHSCDGLDKLAENLHLPLVEDGQWMIFDNMGAYISAAAAEFNGLPIADKHYAPASCCCITISRASCPKQGEKNRHKNLTSIT